MTSKLTKAARPMRVAFMTTVGKNVGDEFIRDGIRSFLDDVLGPGGYDAYYVNKHDLSTLHRPVLDEIEPLADKFADADLIVQAGAPVFWHLGESRCYREDWVKALWHERIFPLAAAGKPFLNLGAGCCQPREGDVRPLLDDPECATFVRGVGACGLLTTARDPLTAELMSSLDLPCELLACPAFHAARRADRGRPVPPRDGILAVNLMELCGHYLLKPENDPKRWSEIILATLPKLRERYRLLFVAHDEAERKFLAYCNTPQEMIFYSPDYRDYLSVYARAAGVVANRVHGAVCAAGFGRPAVIVGTDSRIGIARPIGIPAKDSSEVTPEWIVESIDEQMDRRGQLTEERIELRESSAKRYAGLIRERLAAHPRLRDFFRE